VCRAYGHAVVCPPLCEGDMVIAANLRLLRRQENSSGYMWWAIYQAVL
jgi:hypothetical protein